MLQTPTESCGASVGFMGSWGELVVDDGRFDLVRTGRLRELTEGGDRPGGAPHRGGAGVRGPLRPGPCAVLGPDRLLTRLPHRGPDRRAALPAVRREGDRRRDRGRPVELRRTSWSSPVRSRCRASRGQLTAENAEQVLLHDQYLALPDADREAFLADATEVLFDKLTSGDLPAPGAIAAELLAGGRRASTCCCTRPRHAEQAFFERIGADGSAAPDTLDSVGLVGQNYNGNKIDYFLRRDLTYDVEWDPEHRRGDRGRSRRRWRTRRPRPGSRPRSSPGAATSRSGRRPCATARTSPSCPSTACSRSATSPSTASR